MILPPLEQVPRQERKSKLTPALERFEAKYTPEPMSGCWLWFGAVSRHGYGLISEGVGVPTRTACFQGFCRADA